MSEVFVVIPAYNEEKRLPEVIEKVKKYIPLEQIVVVDDGSKKRIKQFLPKKINVARHIVNLGKGMALKTGCELAIKLGAEKIILMDADGQHDPKEIPAFLKDLNGQYKIVFGARKVDQGMPTWRKLGNQMLNGFAAILFNLNLHDIWCGYRAFDVSVFPDIFWNSSDYSSDVEMVVRAGLNRIKHKERYIATIYSDKDSGTFTTLQDGIKLFLELLLWRIKKI